MSIKREETPSVKSEYDRDERLHTAQIKRAMDRLRRALTKEYYKKEVSDEFKDAFIMTPEHFLDKSFARMSLADLYRRYRRVRIQALTEALGIAGSSKGRDETVSKIRELITEVGQAHYESRQRFEEKEKKEKSSCAAY